MSQVQQPAPSDRSRSTGPRWKFPAVYLVEAAAVGIGLLGTIVYALAGPVASWTTLAAAVMTAAAAMGCGGLLGILFGVPRTVERPQGAEEVPVVSANTNLEQISDWLTKILVGVTLTQLGPIKRGAGELFDWIAPAVGGGDGAAAFAGSVVVYFLVIGFLTGWLYARLRLGVAMSTADSLIELARRADRAGDIQTAEAAKAAARNVTNTWRRTLTPAPVQQEQPAATVKQDQPPVPVKEEQPPAPVESEQQADSQAVPPVEDPGPAPPGGERPESGRPSS